MGRSLLHRRGIEILGFARDDGLFDIEATLSDTKAYPFATQDRDSIEPGEPLHGMVLTLTVDGGMRVHACEARFDFAPYVGCHLVAPNFTRLAGVTIGPGWNRAVRERLGGVEGCTHLLELLAQMATVAFQTLAPVRRRAEAAGPARDQGSTSATAADREHGRLKRVGGAPALLNSCWSYRSDGPVVRRRWPEHFTGSRDDIGAEPKPAGQDGKEG